MKPSGTTPRDVADPGSRQTDLYLAAEELGLDPFQHRDGVTTMICPTCGDRMAQSLAVQPGATAATCRNGCNTDGILKQLQAALAAGATTNGTGPKSEKPEPKKSGPVRIIVAESFATIRAERTSYIWKPRIPVGAPTLLVGREKLGKSTLTVELAAGIASPRQTARQDRRSSPCLAASW